MQPWTQQRNAEGACACACMCVCVCVYMCVCEGGRGGGLGWGRGGVTAGCYTCLHEVVELGVVLHYGISPRPSVDARSGADLDVVPDEHTPQLRLLHRQPIPRQHHAEAVTSGRGNTVGRWMADVSPRRPGGGGLAGHEAEAVGTDVNAGVQCAPLADCAVLQRHVGTNCSAGADGHTAPDRSVGPEHAPAYALASTTAPGKSTADGWMRALACTVAPCSARHGSLSRMPSMTDDPNLTHVPITCKKNL
eukprot:scaffold8481_cov111-Isochrysis_galbana.AAC.1